MSKNSTCVIGYGLEITDKPLERERKELKLLGHSGNVQSFAERLEA
jgi:hypothetical protein